MKDVISKLLQSTDRSDRVLGIKHLYVSRTPITEEIWGLLMSQESDHEIHRFLLSLLECQSRWSERMLEFVQSLLTCESQETRAYAQIILKRRETKTKLKTVSASVLPLLFLSLLSTDSVYAQSKSILDCAPNTQTEIDLSAVLETHSVEPLPPKRPHPGDFWWKPFGTDKPISYEQLPYGQHYVGTIINRLGNPQTPWHRGRQIFKTYVPPHRPDLTLVKDQTDSFSKKLPVYAYRKYPLFKTETGKIVLADPLDGAVHPLWTRMVFIDMPGFDTSIANPLNDYNEIHYDYLNDRIWSPAYVVSGKDAIQMGKEISIGGYGKGHFRLPTQDEYREADRIGIRNVLTGFSSDAVIKTAPMMVHGSFGPHTRNPHWTTARLGESRLLRFHGGAGDFSGYSFAPSSEERNLANYILNLKSLPEAEANEIRNSLGFVPMDSQKAKSLRDRANDQYAVLYYLEP